MSTPTWGTPRRGVDCTADRWLREIPMSTTLFVPHGSRARARLFFDSRDFRKLVLKMYQAAAALYAGHFHLRSPVPAQRLRCGID